MKPLNPNLKKPPRPMESSATHKNARPTTNLDTQALVVRPAVASTAPKISSVTSATSSPTSLEADSEEDGATPTHPALETTCRCGSACLSSSRCMEEPTASGCPATSTATTATAPAPSQVPRPSPAHNAKAAGSPPTTKAS